MSWTRFSKGSRPAARPALLRKHAVPLTTPGTHVKGSESLGRRSPLRPSATPGRGLWARPRATSGLRPPPLVRDEQTCGRRGAPWRSSRRRRWSARHLALISLDRYCAIVRPPREKIGRRRALQLLAGAWLAALGFSLPWELLLTPREAPAAAQSFHRCLYRTSPDPAQLGAAYSVGLVVACYLLPFLLMCFCHYHICKTVRLSDVRVRPLTTYARVLRFFSDVRTATTVLIMIVSVICCWGPYCFLVLLAAARRAQAAQSPSLLNVVAVWLTWANGAINPVIYAVRNPNISMLLGRNREEGYRTRNVDALLPNQGRALQAGTLNPLRNRCTNRLGAWSTMSSSNPTSGVAGDVAMWARKNPVVLFCREGPPDPVTAAAKQSESGDTSL
ncbi:hypothetical protein E5288_WYG001594 [Bos mutus]|uniref:G-protein coupled receptors family 1 profile domain-containing protein n=1 Tax=Bos mutus TaxID=72004 RepID=A0A6B0REA0_9CETA|nr:hypothetical protein [Bos mutus]